MDWGRFAVGGAASRSDSFTGLRPEFAGGLYQMVQAAHAAGIPLQITSAYRSPEVQAKLYEAALKKYGDERTARKWVAPPGRSQHNFGTAADFAVNGSLIRDADSREARWIRENAAKYGLAVPMDWEPWQVEMAGARGGAKPPPATQQPATLPPQQPQNALSAPQSAPENAMTAVQQQQAAMQAFMPRVNALSADPFQNTQRAQPVYGFGAGNNPFVG